MRIVKIADMKVPEAEELAALADSIRLWSHDRGSEMPKPLLKMVNNLPSRYQILQVLGDTDRQILYQTVGHIWRKLTGQKLSDISDRRDTSSVEKLSGCYWMLPGGVMLHGLNHYSAAKRHRGAICAILRINPLVYEQKLNQGANEVIGMIVGRGGVRMLVDRAKDKVFVQTSERSWPWARNKVSKMYHGEKVVKVLDLSKPYRGWTTGVPIVIK
jgi:hypothetical protein